MSNQLLGEIKVILVAVIFVLALYLRTYVL